MPRRSYDQYCPLSRALDVVGERWTLLIVRELLTGPRRYTDLHADLPGVSTDVLAARLKELERDGLVARRRLPPPASAAVYELTPRGESLLPALTALAEWGAAELPAQPEPTDALRAHWFALRLDERTFHVLLGPGGPRYGQGPAERPGAVLTLTGQACLAVAQGTGTLPELIANGQASVDGDGPLAETLRGV
jgi:DNA-binding HxlR family transcriptional regulator